MLNQDDLKKEFVRYHEAFVNLLKFLQKKDNTQNEPVFNDQLAKFFQPGRLRHLQRQFPAGREKFQEAYKINKHNIFLLTYLGIILTVRKNYYAVEKYFTDAIHRDPNNDDAWFYAAENFFKAGIYNKAIESFEKARRLNPANNEIAFRLKDCREAMEKKPKSSERDPAEKDCHQRFRAPSRNDGPVPPAGRKSQHFL